VIHDASPPVVAIVGPTATGKSDLAVRLALRLAAGPGAEIVNADSMQLYAGMDIGTAKLTADERAGVPHHLLDIWPVTAEASVAEYQARARDVLTGIADRGRVAVLVGGSGLYVRAVLDDLRFPGTDPDLRAAIEARAAVDGVEATYARLRVVDPAAAAAIEPSNLRRIVRALEVVELTGRPFAAELPPPGTYAVPAIQIGLDRETTVLDRAVEARADRMLRHGLVDEVRGLLAAGLREGRTASKALGYAQVLDVLDREDPWREVPAADLAQARESTVVGTRRFVRRQRSWFRRDARVRWFDADAPDLDEQVVTHLGSRLTGADGSRPDVAG
jgi:tRNA dimethylallyltransferase